MDVPNLFLCEQTVDFGACVARQHAMVATEVAPNGNMVDCI